MGYKRKYKNRLNYDLEAMSNGYRPNNYTNIASLIGLGLLVGGFAVNYFLSEYYQKPTSNIIIERCIENHPDKQFTSYPTNYQSQE